MTTTQLKPKKQLANPPQDSPLNAHPLLSSGSLTLLLGHPGIGKSLLALNLAAHLSRATPFPPSLESNAGFQLAPPADHEPPTTPASTLLLSAEDTQQTLHARSAAMHADPAYLHILPNPKDNILLPKTPTAEPQLVIAIRMFLAQSPLRLLILDPLPAFLGTHDCTHQNTIRSLLAPLLRLAEQHHFSILGITHLNKSPRSKSKSPLRQAIGSLAYTALARSVHLVTSSPSPTGDGYTTPSQANPAFPRRLVVPLKQNLTATPQAYAFTILPGPDLEWDPTPITNHPLLCNSPTNTQDDPTNPPNDSYAHSQLERIYSSCIA